MRKQSSKQTTTTTITEEKTKYWEEKETIKKTVKVEQTQPGEDRKRSDEVSADQMWRQVNIWMTVSFKN